MESRLSHVALLVPSVDASAAFLNERGIATGEAETFESEGTKEIYVGSYKTQRGLLLLLEAISEGPYKRAVTKRGSSLHHLAIDVLDIEEFIPKAKRAGWELHPVTAQTMSYKTAWLFSKGVPTLIEVQARKDLSSKPVKVSNLELPIQKDQLELFSGIGLGDVVTRGDDLSLTVDGQKLSFDQIAGIK